MSMSATTTDTNQSQSQQTETGLDQNVAATLAYVLGWVTGLIMFLVESDNDHVRFHAAQSIVVFGALTVVSILLTFVQGAIASAMVAAGGGGTAILAPLSAILGLIGLVFNLLILGLWIYLLVQAYQGNDPRIPLAASVAENMA